MLYYKESTLFEVSRSWPTPRLPAVDPGQLLDTSNKVDYVFIPRPIGSKAPKRSLLVILEWVSIINGSWVKIPSGAEWFWLKIGETSEGDRDGQSEFKSHSKQNFSKNEWKLTHTSQKWYTPHTRCMSTSYTCHQPMRIQEFGVNRYKGG